MKWLGAMLIVLTCSGIGMLMASSYRREERLLQQFQAALHWVGCELRCRASDLPALFSRLEDRTDGVLGVLFGEMTRELNARAAPDVFACMQLVLSRVNLNGKLRDLSLQLGSSLGEFYLDGQLRQLELIQADCGRLLEEHRRSGDNRIRSCQTLGVCGGLVLAILLL